MEQVEPHSMQAIVIKNPTKEFCVEIVQIKIPKPKKDEVLIRVSRFPINFFDIQCAMGTQQILRRKNLTPGIEGIGIVVKTGESRYA